MFGRAVESFRFTMGEFDSSLSDFSKAVENFASPKHITDIEESYDRAIAHCERNRINHMAELKKLEADFMAECERLGFPYGN